MEYIIVALIGYYLGIKAYEYFFETKDK